MGLTRLRADQISDIDYKQAVRVITVTNITNLSGGAPSQVDGVNLSIGDRILVNGQNTGSQNGIYQVQTVGSGSNGTWIRSIDTNQTGELEAGTIVMVTEGTAYKDTQWKLITNNPIIIGTTALTFEQNSAYAFGNVVANTTAVLANTVGATITFEPGSGIQILGNNTTKTVTIAATGTAAVDSISNGTSNVSVVSSGGNVTVGINGTSNVAVFSAANIVASANLLPSANVTYSLGSTSARWKDLWIANSSIYIGDVTIATVGSALTINGANVLTGNAGSNLSTTGNVIGGNITTTGIVSATGNITGNYIFGNGSQLTGIDATSIQSGTSNVRVVSSGGNVATGIGGTANVVVVATTGQFVTGVNSVSGNITGGNLLTGGLISATGNITANYIIGNGSQLTGLPAGYANSNAAAYFASGTVSTNILTTANVSATGNVTAGNVSATNLTGTLATAAQTNITSVGTLTSLNSGAISSSGNVTTAGQFVGAGTGLTGTASSLTVGTATVAGTVTTAAQPNITSVGTLTSLNSGAISSSGTVTAASFSGAGTGLTGTAASLTVGAATSPVFTGDSASGGNIVSRKDTGFYENPAANTATGWPVNSNSWQHMISCTHSNDANYYALQLAATFFDQGLYYRSTNGSGATAWSTVALHGTTPAFAGITNSGSNGVGNIGSASTYFNTVFARATSALYADLAEMYVADADYPPGTLVEFGGVNEVTATTQSHSTRVAGIVSTNPSYLMNAAQPGDTVIPVALTGRVPCSVVGTIEKGDRLVASNIAGVAQRLDPEQYQPACIVGKALENYDSDQPGVIEVAVGRT